MANSATAPLTVPAGKRQERLRTALWQRPQFWYNKSPTRDRIQREKSPQAASSTLGPRRLRVEIQALKLLITEKDLNEMVAQHLPEDPEIRKIRIQLAAEGVYVTGVYQMLFNVPFETLWELAILGGKLSARLAGFKALGLPVTMFKSMLMNVVSDAVGSIEAIEIADDSLQLDVERLLAGEGFSVRTNLTAVRCHAGHLVLEATANGDPGPAKAATFI